MGFVRFREDAEPVVIVIANEQYSDSPARRLMQHLLSRFICYGKTVPGTLLDRPAQVDNQEKDANIVCITTNVEL